MKKICVVVADDGSISVGVEPEGGEEGMGKDMGAPMEVADMDDEMGGGASYLQPVGSAQEALARVRELISEDPEADAAGEAAFSGAFEKRTKMNGRGML